VAFKIIGTIGALITATGFIPQIIKAFMLKDMKDVSTTMLLQIFVGTALWIVYGMSISDPIIIVANIVTCSSTAILLVMQRIYNNGRKTAHAGK
jgi:MtN3 and saliva related transmembrane protein